MTTNPTFTGKCTTCGKTFVLTEEAVKEAQAIGVPFSPCCQAVATIVHVKANLQHPTDVQVPSVPKASGFLRQNRRRPT